MKRTFLLLTAIPMIVSAQVSQYVPADNLEIWCPFDSTYSNMIDGSMPWQIIGSPQFGTGREYGSYSLWLNEAGQHLISAFDWFPAFGDHTISFWFVCNDPSDMNQTLYNTSPHTIEAVGVNIWQSYDIGTIGACVGPGDVGVWDSCGQYEYASADFSGWTHLVSVKSGEDLRLWLNGDLVFQTSGSSYENSLVGFYLGESSHTEGYTSHEFLGRIQDFGMWSRALDESEITSLYIEESIIFGCLDEGACNFSFEANSDDGSCVFPTCTDSYACNFDSEAVCGGGNCDYSCCPGPGCCLEGTVWDAELGGCIQMGISCHGDLDFDGIIGVNDLMALLSTFGTDCPDVEEPEIAEWICGDPVNYHGYDYLTVQIGEQCWFAENLRTLKYRSGASIPSQLTDNQWQETNQGACALFGDPAFTCTEYVPEYDACTDSENVLSNLGLLYNHFAVTHSDSLCPPDWSIPNQSDWDALKAVANATGVASGIALKDSIGWRPDPYWGAAGLNILGFNGNAGGYRVYSGGFHDAGWAGHWWTPEDEFCPGCAYSQRLQYNISVLDNSTGDKNNGYSVRCIQN